MNGGDLAGAEEIPIGGCRLNQYSFVLSNAEGDNVELTSIQTRLLLFLSRRSGTWTSVDTLAACVWGHSHRLKSDCYKQAICLVRRKMRAVGGGVIDSDRLMGYRFRSDAEC